MLEMQLVQFVLRLCYEEQNEHNQRNDRHHASGHDLFAADEARAKKHEEESDNDFGDV